MTQTLNNSKGWNIALWIAQSVLAVMFLMAGIMKSTTPIGELAATVPWVTEVPMALVRFIGISELLGGLGLLLPALLRIKPMLTPYAAVGLAIVMVFAMIYHVSKGEFNALPFNFLLALVAAFIAWGRFKKAPIYPKAK